MTVGVINGFKVVDVRHQGRQRTVAASGLGQLPVQHFRKAPPVGQPCQWVGHHQPRDRFISGGQFAVLFVEFPGQVGQFIREPRERCHQFIVGQAHGVCENDIAAVDFQQMTRQRVLDGMAQIESEFYRTAVSFCALFRRDQTFLQKCIDGLADRLFAESCIFQKERVAVQNGSFGIEKNDS